jgi:hypothetical protein
MRVMVLVKASVESEAGRLPTTGEFAAMGAFNEALAGAGVLVTGEGLKPSAAGKRVRFDGDARTVVDGPFGATEELVAGFWIWQVASMDDAVAWARRCPNPMPGGGVLELRPLYEMADFGDELTPELREREERLRVQLEGE